MNQNEYCVVPRAKRARLSSKWFDQIIVEGATRSEGRTCIGTEHRPMKPLRCKKLKPTLSDSQMIEACLVEADELMKGFGLMPARITSDRIHFLSAKVFKRISGNSREPAFSTMGHIYINAKVCRLNKILAVVVTHELAHLLSFIAVLFLEDVKFPEFLVGLKASAAHLGILDSDSFWGLNEVATEMAAHGMRRGLIEKGLIAKRDIPYVENFLFEYSYHELTCAILKIFCRKPEDAKEFSRQLVHCMLTGSKSFFATLEKRGLLNELLALSPRNDDVEAFIKRHIK